MITIERKIGTNRGTARLWLEGKTLAQYGWTKGTQFTAAFHDGGLIYRKGTQHEGKTRKVAGADNRPVIDTNTDQLLTLGLPGAMVTVLITEEYISIK